MARADQFAVVGFDADDTLWRNEDYFPHAQTFFVDRVGPHAPPGIDVLDALHATEIDNLPVSGYGIKSFALSMVQATITTTGGKVPAAVIGELVDHAHDMLRHPVELLDGVAETLEQVGRTHRLVLITKGDLVDQMRKRRDLPVGGDGPPGGVVGDGERGLHHAAPPRAGAGSRTPGPPS